MMQYMKDSGIRWIGEIPAEWELNKIKYIASSIFQGNGITKEDVVEDGDTFCVRYGEIYTKYNFAFKDCVTKTNEKLISSRRYFSHGDILFVGTGESVEEIGKNIAYLGNEKCLAGGDIIVVQHNQNPSFLSYAMNSYYAQAQKSYGKAKLKVVHISPADIGNLMVLLPPLAEQQAIASFLDAKCAKLDSIITDLERQIEILQEYKKSVITHAVTKGLNPVATMKDSGIEWIGDIPAHWDAKRMKYILAEPLQYGANETGDDYDENLPRYIRITDITDDNSLKNEGEQSLQFNVAKPYLLQDGDVLFARSGATVGKTFLYTKHYGIAAFAGYLIKAQTDKSKVLPRFLFYTTLGNGYDNWKNMVFSQATIQNIGADKYAQLIVTIPPLKEQEGIINFLDIKCTKADQILSDKRDQLRAIQENKSSLIYEYVTGKKCVKEAAIHAD